MSYEFMDMINRHLENQILLKEQERWESEKRRAIKLEKIACTVIGTGLVLLSFLMETPH